jgi:hypothetical protein
MTVRKVNLIALGVLALSPAFVLSIFIIKHEADWGVFFTILILALAAWVVGVFVGIVLAVIVQRPRIEPYLYMSTQLAVIVTVAAFVLAALFPRRTHDQENVRENHSFVNLDRSMYEAEPREYVRTAFLELESKFADPNSFLLERYSCRWRDTVIDSKPDTLYFVDFAYLKHTRAFYARVLVMDNVALVDKMDMEKRPDPHDASTKAGVWARRGDLEDVKKALKDLPDSTRQQVLDVLEDKK